jgi:hypothetical protein
MPRKKAVPDEPVGAPMVTGESYESLLNRTLERLKVAVFDPGTSPKDLAALTKRMLDVKKELEGLEGSDDDGGDVGGVSDSNPDSEWEPV